MAQIRFMSFPETRDSSSDQYDFGDHEESGVPVHGASRDSIELTAEKDKRMSYIVELNTHEAEHHRSRHMQKIEYMCSRSDIPAGIEGVFETTFCGYVGVFTKGILDSIRQDIALKPHIVKAVTPNESAEIYARTIYGSTANWGSSCISNGADWDVDATNENGLWPYRKTLTEKGGENTIVFLIDEGGIDIFDFQKDTSRIVNVDKIALGDSNSHATIMANVISGDTFGLAPRSKLWVYTGTPKLTKVAVLLAFEEIARFDFEKQNIKPTGGILCLPFAFHNSEVSNCPLRSALKYLITKTQLKVVIPAANNSEHVTEYKTFPQNNGELILVGGSDKYNNLASGSDYGEKISLYAPAVDIPVLLSGNDSGKPSVSEQTTSGNCFGAAHVCGVISLIMSDDDVPATQAIMKDALTTHFFECTKYKGNLPIKVLKKFMRKPEEKESRDKRSSSGASRSISSGSSRFLMVPERGRTPSPSSDEHKCQEPATQSSTPALVITQKSSHAYYISLKGDNSMISVHLSSEELFMLLDEMHRETPDYDLLADILGKDSMNRGHDIHAIFGEISSIRIELSWDVRSPSHLQDRRERNRLRESLFR